MAAEVHPTATVHEGTVLGEGVKVLENAVVGKQPTLSPRSTAKRAPLAPAEIGDGTVVSTGAIVFAGSRIGARVVLGDQSCVRERVTIGDDVVLGRGSLVENDTTVGAMTETEDDAIDLVESLRGRLGTVEQRVEERRDAGRRPRRVVALQQLDPPAAAGHWVPEQVRRAGGWEVLGEAASPRAVDDLRTIQATFNAQRTWCQPSPLTGQSGGNW